MSRSHIEELALIEDLQQLHYGRCCVIGKIAVDLADQQKFYIENIRLPNLPEQYSLPEGSVTLRITCSDLFISINAFVGKVCEIAGDVVLYDTVESSGNRIPLTSRDLLEQAKHLQSQQAPTAYPRERYVPAVSINTIEPIERGANLAELNLQIRMLGDS